MYAECKQYLLDALKSAGIKSNPYTSQKALEKSMESHLGAVLFESETYLRNGSKTYFKDQEGAQKKRRKVFDRSLAFSVVIGEYSDDAVEAILSRFLAQLAAGIVVDGNYIPIEVDGADWVDKDDSILRAKTAVLVKVTFLGGVYRDTGSIAAKKFELESVTKERSL